MDIKRINIISEIMNESIDNVNKSIQKYNSKYDLIRDTPFIMESMSSDVQAAINNLKQQKKWIDTYCGRFTGKQGFWINEKRHKIEDDQEKQNLHDIILLIKKLCTTNSYDEYITIRRALADEVFDDSLWDLNSRVMFMYSMLGGFSHLDENSVAFITFGTEKRIPTSERTRLFHTSNVAGLTQLKPTFRSVDNGVVETLYPSYRVYFALNQPINRTNNFNWNGEGHVYEYMGPKENITVKEDTELGKPACFIETDKPVPVKDVTEEMLRDFKK